MEIRAVEFGPGVDAQEAEAGAHFVLENLEQAHEPGLAVRCPGEVREDKLRIIRECDAIFISRLKVHGWYDKVWQAYAALIPVKTVGVKGDERSYEWAISLRAVISEDAMTADWVELPYSILRETSHRILNEVKGINRVLYDISTKPPASIEWE